MYLNIASNPEVVEFLENWELTADHVGEFLLKMQVDGIDHEEVAIWLLQEYEDLWSSWLPEEAADRVRTALETASV